MRACCVAALADALTPCAGGGDAPAEIPIQAAVQVSAVLQQLASEGTLPAARP